MLLINYPKYISNFNSDFLLSFLMSLKRVEIYCDLITVLPFLQRLYRVRNCEALHLHIRIFHSVLHVQSEFRLEMYTVYAPQMDYISHDTLQSYDSHDVWPPSPRRETMVFHKRYGPNWDSRLTMKMKQPNQNTHEAPQHHFRIKHFRFGTKYYDFKFFFKNLKLSMGSCDKNEFFFIFVKVFLWVKKTSIHFSDQLFWRHFPAGLHKYLLFSSTVLVIQYPGFSLWLWQRYSSCLFFKLQTAQ